MQRETQRSYTNQFFRGKVVLIYLLNAPEDFRAGLAISDPRIEEVNGRLFVIGTVPELLNDWSSGQRVGVAFDQIAHFLEFSSEQEFIDRSSSWDDVNGVGPN